MQSETSINRGPNVQYWLEGGDAALFTIPYLGHVAVRPLPAGEYEYMYLDRSPANVCNAYPKLAKKKRLRNMVAVAPEGTLHELFFDPVTVGTTDAADSANGVLIRRTFTDVTARLRPSGASRTSPQQALIRPAR